MSLRLHTPLPSLEGVTKWIPTQPELSDNKSGPLLVYFWAISCNICHKNMSTLDVWREKYVPQGLQLISIHCPRMKTDTDVDKVKISIEKYGITEPCGIDNMHRVKKAFDNQFWPSYFLFDEDLKLQRRTAGRSGLAMLEPLIKNMI